MTNGNRYEFVRIAIGPFNKRHYICVEGCQTIFSRTKELAKHMYDEHSEERLR
jgi:hypothetical protein